MEERFCRTEQLLGSSAMEKLKNSKVALFGVGGVGGYACEALVRSGVGAIDIIDGDKVAISNLNRQIIALTSTVGRFKAEVAAERARDINPAVKVRAFNEFYSPDKADKFPFAEYDYIIDAIDTVSAKLSIICECKKAGVPVISCMGAGNKLRPDAFEVADIYETSVCPLARVMRGELRKRGVESLKVVYSKELPVNSTKEEDGNFKRVPASCAFVPAAAGLVLAGEVIKDLIAEK